MNLNTKQFFQKAEEGKYAIGAFNFSTADQIKAIVDASVRLKSPVLLATSQGERDFFGIRQAVKIAEAYEETTGMPIILNADHTKSVEKVEEALKAGYNCIHFDGSELDYEENVRQTKQVVKIVQSFSEDISVEGELGFIAGSSQILKEKVEIKPEYYTDPDQALDFVERTGVDRMAVVVGNIHGISPDEPDIDIERLKKIYALIKGKAVIVFHAGSGVPNDQIKEAIEHGVRKINVNTELRVAFHDGLKNVLNSTDQTTPYKFMPTALEKMEQILEEKIKLFRSEHKAL